MAECLTVCSYCEGAGSFGAKRKCRRVKQDGQINSSRNIGTKTKDEATQIHETMKIVAPMSSYDKRHPLQAQPRKACSVCGGCGLVPAVSQATSSTSSGLNVDTTIGALPSDKSSQGKAPQGNSCPSEACVAIVGGGLGGLALALALQHRGVPCVVLERDAHMDARAQGYGLTLQQGATAANSLGLLEACREAGVTTSNGRGFSHCSFQWDGKLLGQHGGRARGHAKSSGGRSSETVSGGLSNQVSDIPTEAGQSSTSSRDVVGQPAADGSASNCLNAHVGSSSGSTNKSNGGGPGNGNHSSNSGSASQKQNLLLSRQALRGLLLSRLNPGTVRWGCTLTAVIVQPAPEKPDVVNCGAISKENFRLWVREVKSMTPESTSSKRKEAVSTEVEGCGSTPINAAGDTNRGREADAMAPILLPHKVAVLVGADGIRSSVRALLDGISTGQNIGCTNSALATASPDTAIRPDLTSSVVTPDPDQAGTNSQPYTAQASRNQPLMPPGDGNARSVHRSSSNSGRFFSVDGNSESGLVYLGVVCVLGIVATSDYLPMQPKHTAEVSQEVGSATNTTAEGLNEAISAAVKQQSTGDIDEVAVSVSNVEISETVDGVTRLYRMPFSRGAHNGGDRDMWQLSWPEPNEQVARSWVTRGSEALLAEARRRCSGWHAPLPALLGACCANNVTGYPLYDRPVPWQPNSLLGPNPDAAKTPVSFNAANEAVPAKEVTAGAALERTAAAAGASLVNLSPSARQLLECSTLLGDAAHPMAPFKGQGANQALLDAISLARVLYDSTLGDQALPLPRSQASVEHVAGVDASMQASAAAAASVPTSAQMVLSIKNHSGQGLKRSQCSLPLALEAYATEMQSRAAVKMATSRSNTTLLHSAAALTPVHGSITRAAAAAKAISTKSEKFVDGNEGDVPAVKSIGIETP